MLMIYRQTTWINWQKTTKPTMKKCVKRLFGMIKKKEIKHYIMAVENRIIWIEKQRLKRRENCIAIWGHVLNLNRVLFLQNEVVLLKVDTIYPSFVSFLSTGNRQTENKKGGSRFTQPLPPIYLQDQPYKTTLMSLTSRPAKGPGMIADLFAPK